MKEEVRDILLPYVMLLSCASIPVRTERGLGHAWMARRPSFHVSQPVAVYGTRHRPLLDPIPQPHFPDPQIVDPGYLAQGQQLFNRAGNDGTIEANAVLFHVS